MLYPPKNIGSPASAFVLLLLRLLIARHYQVPRPRYLSSLPEPRAAGPALVVLPRTDGKRD